MARLIISLSRKPLLNIYKSFVRPHLDCGDISYHKPTNENLKNKLEKNHIACLAITGCTILFSCAFI